MIVNNLRANYLDQIIIKMIIWKSFKSLALFFSWQKRKWAAYDDSYGRNDDFIVTKEYILTWTPVLTMMLNGKQG